LTNHWPLRRILLWSILTLLAVALAGPGYLRAFQTAESNLVDFHQEWTSAKFFLDDLPVYTKIEVGLERYQKLRRPPKNVPFIEYNAHPPTSVLLVIPFARMEYAQATLVWNLLSIAMIVPIIATIYVQLGIRFRVFHLLVLIPLLLTCEPLYQQIIYGQWNLILLGLIVGGWAAERSGRPILAGVLLGTAAVLKFFPALLFVHYLLLGRWRLAAAGVVTALGWTALTVAILGFGAYRDYVEIVLPHVAKYQLQWWNLSFAGFWARLFDGNIEFYRSYPIYYAPWLGKILAAVCDLVALAIIAVTSHRASTLESRDLAFGLCLIGALLLSPLAWTHYVVLLFLPLFLLWRRMRLESLPVRILFVICVAILWINPIFVWSLWIPEVRKPPIWAASAQPWQLLAGVSVPFYALLAIFVLTAVTILRRGLPRNGVEKPIADEC